MSLKKIKRQLCESLFLEGGPDGALLPVPESVVPQTKVPIFGRDPISSRKAQAMKQAKDRKKQVARLGSSPNLEFPPLSVDKLDPEFVSDDRNDSRFSFASAAVFQKQKPDTALGSICLVLW